MKFFLHKLCFSTPVHFGGDNALSLESAQMTFCADTLFSALCHTAFFLGGNAQVEELCDAARQGALLLSDGMPYAEKGKGKEDELYLPRPFLMPGKRTVTSSQQRKNAKKTRYLPVLKMDEYMKCISEGQYMDMGTPQNFGTSVELTKAAVPENEETRPYFVGAYYFRLGCGLYFLVGCEEELENQIERLLRLLGTSGIGGKISAGFGKFEPVDLIDLSEPFDLETEWLSRALMDKEAPIQMTLSACLPMQEELNQALEGAQYQLIRRGGFISDPAQSGTPRKKRSQCVFQAGSTFRRRFAGQLSEVGKSAGHAVYRYNRPLWLGVRT